MGMDALPRPVWTSKSDNTAVHWTRPARVVALVAVHGAASPSQDAADPTL
jgi:hypothetical protein